MTVDREWDQVREIVSRAKRSTGHFAIASVDRDGMPNVTPIGTVFLRDDRTGFYFDQYTSALASNLDANPRVCLSAVDSGSLFWFRSLLTGRFATPPGVRLYGTAGPRRLATAAELEQVRRRVRPMLLLKGGRLLWSDFTHVRELTFDSFRLVRYPVMMPKDAVPQTP
ncbi:pyridoxamine 5'-phosphate oxidase family protein [Nocardia sp. NBC_01503]|uniref:pyridoxamine 5'-phosphate oxidase family protein n=1 Tax=Nocardia sp. NBC_01503 TaxID=2975997 RepID=UPI002E7B0EC3|nr:pyridoxamine 5'-phosphate oxidase family protein [Nocardia sp. NBC_01503]WTL30946.1 pyridoxamine 5'-phosphate oxidase family protein [Nocardia sp. NBC_01503]